MEKSNFIMLNINRITFKIIVLGVVFGIGLGACKRGTQKSNDGVNSPVVLQTAEDQGDYSGIFDIAEIEIAPSPDTACEYVFPKQEQIVDYNVSPAGSLVVALTVQDGRYALKFWSLGATDISNGCAMPNNFKAEKVVWHPKGSALFVLGTENAESRIYRVENDTRDWTLKLIYSSAQKIVNMVTCPQPFGTDYKKYAYRLFLGMDNGDNSYRIVSITEHGEKFYQVVGPVKTQTEDLYYDPSMNADWALPVVFHPAGHQLIWQDKNQHFFVADYSYSAWRQSSPIELPLKNKETLMPTPNGLGMMTWQKNTSGIEIYLIPDKSTSHQLSEYQFDTSPIFVPDGKGIVGKTVDKNIHTLHYEPVTIPFANVLNAWMFMQSSEELDLFQKQQGLFRLTNHEQLYEIYESEIYDMEYYPARPHIVTTDIFWELFGGAYQGVFVLKEREQAMPDFWKFINEAAKYFKTHHQASLWNSVFDALKDLENKNSTNKEALRIINEADGISDVTHTQYAYSDLKPRGHYTSSPEQALYFKAFRYFTTILADSKYQNVLKELDHLPAETIQYAINWINGYSNFIAPSRSPLVWKDLKMDIPGYCLYPKDEKAVFPLSWGFDNEIFYSTVYHENFPEHLRICGLPDDNGFLSDDKKRLLPSGVDIASVLGNGMADKLMADEYTKYPPLRNVIDNLRSTYMKHANTPDFEGNLYNKWMNAMAMQWSDDVLLTTETDENDIWQVKRLQTGLATWATLRHTTILVNERVGAEAGGGGFETLLMKAPRGCVEPDPYTFSAIADLFQELILTVSQFKVNETHQQAIYHGLIERLKEAKEETLLFAAMAEKERNGEKLTNEEHEKIFYVARVAEHLFLVFVSLSDKEYGLALEPIGKITDVAHVDWSKFAANKGVYTYLMAAVGNPIEWNYLVPYYGRSQIVKGAIYSYYEFESQSLLNDEEWRQSIHKQAILPWIKPYITLRSTSNHTGYYSSKRD